MGSTPRDAFGLSAAEDKRQRDPSLAHARVLELAEVDRIRRSDTKNAILLGNARQQSDEKQHRVNTLTRSALHATKERKVVGARKAEVPSISDYLA